MKTEDKGKKYICWRESGRLRLAGESRFIKKGLSTGFFFTETACKVNTDSILSANYWSSTENSNNSNNAFNVNFDNGNVNNNNKNNTYRVRCVLASLIEPNNNKQ